MGNSVWQTMHWRPVCRAKLGTARIIAGASNIAPTRIIRPGKAVVLSRDDAVDPGGTRPPDAFFPARISSTRPEAGFHLSARALREENGCSTACIRLRKNFQL